MQKEHLSLLGARCSFFVWKTQKKRKKTKK